MMKYFRFLYGETGRCFIHFGEIRDTKTKEHFTFLYLRSANRHVKQTEAEHTLFLCPKKLNLVVMGSSDEASVEAMREVLADTSVDTLVYSVNSNSPILELASGVRKTVCLTDKGSEADGGGQSCKIEAAGWKIAVRCCGNGSLMMTYALAADANAADVNTVDANAAAEIQTRSDRACLYNDCVMNVKIVSEDKRCCLEQEPDGYGCALGCSLHQDYDVCNFQRKDTRAYATGTVLIPEECGGLQCETLIRELKGELSKTRFLGLPTGIEPDTLRAITEALGQPEGDAYKCYFIGSGPELADETIAAVSRSSMYHIPLILQPGKALCCSGLLKYAE